MIQVAKGKGSPGEVPTPTTFFFPPESVQRFVYLFIVDSSQDVVRETKQSSVMMLLNKATIPRLRVHVHHKLGIVAVCSVLWCVRKVMLGIELYCATRTRIRYIALKFDFRYACAESSSIIEEIWNNGIPIQVLAKSSNIGRISLNHCWLPVQLYT